MSTLLSIVQDMCGRQNIPVPATVYGTSDPQVLQIMRLLEEEGNDLSSRADWERLTFEAAVTTLATENQGTIESLCTNGFRSIKNDTIWDRTTMLPVCGPLSSKDWQTLKAVLSTGPRYLYRIRGGNLIVNPAPPAGSSWYFEYVTNKWLTDSGGTTYKRRFTADTDIVLLPDDLCLQGLRWRWKKEKGMDYAEDMRTYEIQVKNALGQDGSKPQLKMDMDGSASPVPGIFVSPGSWI